jgi:hypothetical protein
LIWKNIKASCVCVCGGIITPERPQRQQHGRDQVHRHPARPAQPAAPRRRPPAHQHRLGLAARVVPAGARCGSGLEPALLGAERAGGGPAGRPGSSRAASGVGSGGERGLRCGCQPAARGERVGHGSLGKFNAHGLFKNLRCFTLFLVLEVSISGHYLRLSCVCDGPALRSRG